jgi:hypothetical protein
MVGFTMSRLGAGGIDWRYARRGDGPSVLLLHTLRTQAEYFAALVRHLDGTFKAVGATAVPGAGTGYFSR